MRSFACLICALILRWAVNAAGEFTPAGRSLHVNDGNFSRRDHVTPEAPHQTLSGSAFHLKVQVHDVLSRQRLSQAVVEVYTNYTMTNSALTGDDGGVLLHVPYRAGAPIMIVASRDGYVYSLLPCKPNRLPIFSSVTMSLLARNQGNIWIFEDSVCITGKTSKASSRPVVQFPKRLLNLTDGRNVSAVNAYLTIPKLRTEDSFLNTLGVMSSRSGYVGVDLRPVAAVSAQLFSGDTELHVRGPIQISLSVPDSSGLQPADAVPAWFFNRTTGGWMRDGLGTVVSVDGELMWTFTAPHLGYWIAAPLSSTRGFFGLDIPIDFIWHYSSFLTVVLGGMLLTVICLLLGLLFHHRRWLGETKTKIPPVSRKDQTTSTCAPEELDVSSRDSLHPQDGFHQSSTGRELEQHNASFISTHNGSIIANPGAVAIAMERNELELNIGLNDLTVLHQPTDQIRVPGSLMDNLFFYNQPVAILHAPALFHLEEQPELLQRSKSATLPRSGATNRAATEPQSEDSVTQTPSNTQNQAAETGDQLGADEASQEGTSTTTSRGHFSLQESASVPGTLHKIGGNRHSVHALAGLSEIPSLQPPRAWFVSLEGKPAAEIHYAVSEEQRRRRPAESRETSLDSGVDMSELNQMTGRRAVTLERNATFVKNTPSSKQVGPQ